jgi:hypothetical protein
MCISLKSPVPSTQLINKISVKNYKNLLQYIIKKGKKTTLEKNFKQGLIV